MNEDYGIRSAKVPKKKSDFDWAESCAAQLRLLMRHLRDLKSSGTTFMPAGLKPLLDLVEIPEITLKPSMTSSADEAPAPIVQPVRRSLQVQHSCFPGASVKICSISCNCLLCVKPAELHSSSDEAVENSRSVPSARGAHKAMVTAGTPSIIKNKKVMKRPGMQVRKRPASSAARQFKIVHRQKGNPEAYVLNHGKYLCTCTRSTSPGYLEH